MKVPRDVLAELADLHLAGSARPEDPTACCMADLAASQQQQLAVGLLCSSAAAGATRERLKTAGAALLNHDLIHHR